jgi:hypothetical protein
VSVKTCILITGMHRSGTSAATRVVNLLGADISADLMPPALDDNERGFWESRAVAQIHDDLLKSLGAAWNYPYHLPEHWIKSSTAQQAKVGLAAEIKKDFDNSSLFVIKDPRMSRLLPLWLELLDDLKIEPIVVIPFRNPLEVAESLRKRNGTVIAQTMLLYLWSNLDVESSSRGRPRLWVDYAQLLENWRLLAERLTVLTGGRLSAASPQTQDAIGHFLGAELRHNVNTRAQLIDNRDIADCVVEIFDLMCQAADTGDESRLHSAFDRLRSAMVETEKLYQRFLSSEIGRMEEDLAGLRQAKDAELASLRRESASALAQLRAEHEATLARAISSNEDIIARLRQGIEVASRTHAVELTALRSSVSWRLTAPMRTVSTVFPALRRAARRALRLDRLKSD